MENKLSGFVLFHSLFPFKLGVEVRPITSQQKFVQIEVKELSSLRQCNQKKYGVRIILSFPFPKCTTKGMTAYLCISFQAANSACHHPSRWLCRVFGEHVNGQLCVEMCYFLDLECFFFSFFFSLGAKNQINNFLSTIHANLILQESYHQAEFGEKLAFILELASVVSFILFMHIHYTI